MILMKVVVTTDNDIPAENRNTFPVMIISTAKADTLQRRMMIISKVTMTMILAVNRTDIFACALISHEFTTSVTMK